MTFQPTKHIHTEAELIAFVESGDLDGVDRVLSSPQAQHISIGMAITKAPRKGQPEILERLLKSKYFHMMKPAFLNTALLRTADLGDIRCLRLLLPYTDPKKDDSCALRKAALSGDVDCVKELIPRANPADRNFEALHNAAEQGHVECMKLLIPGASPSGYARALRKAAMKGQIECIRILSGLSDPRIDACAPIRIAAEMNQLEAVRFLIPLSDLDVAKAMLRNDFSREMAAEYIGRIDQMNQEYLLLDKVRDIGKGQAGRNHL